MSRLLTEQEAQQFVILLQTGQPDLEEDRQARQVLQKILKDISE